MGNDIAHIQQRVRHAGIIPIDQVQAALGVFDQVDEIGIGVDQPLGQPAEIGEAGDRFQHLLGVRFLRRILDALQVGFDLGEDSRRGVLRRRQLTVSLDGMQARQGES